MPREEKQTKSLLTRFNILLIVFYLCSLMIATPVAYWVARDQTYQSAHKELQILVDVMTSLRSYISGHVRPQLLEKDVFHAPAVSGIVATSLIARYFVELQPEYYIKVASDNPLNPANKPELLEQKLLERYRADPSLKTFVEKGEIRGKPFLVSSRPTKSNPSCQGCHGDPTLVPDEITSVYGTETGFGYPMEKEVVGVAVVGVPIGHVESVAINRSLATIGIITALFTVLIIFVNIMMRKSVIKPLMEITATARAVSKGDLDIKMQMDRNDEIGSLAHSFELMRRSLVTMLKRSRS